MLIYEDNKWGLSEQVHEMNQDYKEALLKYLNIIDPIFMKASKVCEFEFLFTLLRFRGVNDGGWDPYETSVSAIKGVGKLLNSEERLGEVFFHLGLWMYGHILEASEPYEILTNLINVAQGGRYNPVCYPPKPRKNSKGQVPIFPIEKIENIVKIAHESGFKDIDVIFNEVYNRELRNAIFHSDYALDKRGLRILNPQKSIPWTETLALINRALAYFDAIWNLYRAYIGAYDESVVIPAHPEFSRNSNEMVRVIIREGYGAVGLRTEATPEEIQKGKIIFRVGKYFLDERELLQNNPELNVLPPRENVIF